MIHLCFDFMVAVGMLMLLWGVWLALWWWRRRDLPGGWPGKVFLAGGALSGIATTAAMECGWIVTEVGRQPWTVYGIMLTSQAATTASGVPGTLAATVAIYLVLTVATFAILWVMKRRWDTAAAPAEVPVPYSPSAKPEARSR
jgi:cytochrome d ubiquinol oxidase subunit I